MNKYEYLADLKVGRYNVVNNKVNYPVPNYQPQSIVNYIVEGFKAGNIVGLKEEFTKTPHNRDNVVCLADNISTTDFIAFCLLHLPEYIKTAGTAERLLRRKLQDDRKEYRDKIIQLSQEYWNK